MSGQDLKILLDLLGCLAGMFLGVGCHNRDAVAALADLFAGDDGELCDALALDARHNRGTFQVVGALDVLGGQDFDDAGHFLSFRRVDADNFRVGDL